MDFSSLMGGSGKSGGSGDGGPLSSSASSVGLGSVVFGPANSASDRLMLAAIVGLVIVGLLFGFVALKKN